jgi:hypothetical protein
MELADPWPYLLFLALDGAAGVCAVLLVRRAARAESSLAPRLAVWGLVAASSAFNWTHAPHRPAAPEAFGLMPAVAALLFEFCLRELRLRTGADQADRKLSALGWLRPAERIRVQLCMATGEQASAEAATRHVRVSHAAKRLTSITTLRTALTVKLKRPPRSQPLRRLPPLLSPSPKSRPSCATPRPSTFGIWRTAGCPPISAGEVSRPTR